jgi:23S rRNA pseudouridine1911/1915/1917 synthase
MQTVTTLTVAFAGSRLDRYVSDHLPALSRAAVQRLIDEAQIRVDGIARKASYRVQAGESITVRNPPPEPATPRAEAIPLDILYEDADLIVVNKPAGMVVHPAAGIAAGTLVNAILAYCPNLNVGGVERPGIVHRLDSDTSGIIVVAKNDMAMRDLQSQFKSRRVHKTYLALVEGHVKPPRGKIDAPIGRDPKHRQKMAVIPLLPCGEPHGSKGSSPLQRAGAQSASADLNLISRRIHSTPHARDAVTVYRALATLNGYTLVQAEPQTGRTHQIRVHLAFLGVPVVADAIYGKKTRLKNVGQENALGLARQFLHAWKIAFKLRNGRDVSFTAPLPEDLRTVLEELKFDPHILRA